MHRAGSRRVAAGVRAKLGRGQALAGRQPVSGAAELGQRPSVLFAQIDQIQGTYPVVINELIPVQLQARFSQLSGYARGAEAPALVDDDDLPRAIAAIRARRVELLGLARNESAVATAKWYALARIKRDLEEVLESLVRWDRSPTPLAEQLAECTRPRGT